MLVATAALGLVAPIAAQASDINTEGMNSYARSKSTSKTKRFDSKSFSNDLAKINKKVDALEDQLDGIEAGSFSSTTTMNGKVVYALGAIDEGDTIGGSEALSAAYVFKMELNTSFTGDDNLYVRLAAGEWGDNFMKKPGNYHVEAKNTKSGSSEPLIVDKLWYTFYPTDNTTVWVGPGVENYYMMAAAPSIYKPGVLKAFKLGGNGAVFGASTDGGAGVKYEFGDSGFAVSTNYVGKGSSTSSGILTKEDKNKIDTQFAYTKPQYHVSLTASKQQNGWDSSEYYSTNDIHEMGSAADAKAYALRAYWRPEESGTAVPEISVGYDLISFTGHALFIDKGEGYFVGLGWQDTFQADDRIGIAFGQPVKATEAETSNDSLSEVDPFLWEAYYSFKPNDSITITPAVFGGSDISKNETQDIFGTMLTTTFKF